MGLFRYGALCFFVLLLFRTCLASDQKIGQILPGFQASQDEYNDHNGFFLLSKSSVFALGFYTTLDVSLFVLVVIHLGSSKIVWTANRGLLVKSSDKFVFDNNGDAFLERQDGVVWSTKTAGEKAAAMELRDSGNLVVVGENGTILWESFRYPTDTLLSGQVFEEGMKLKSFRNKNNMSHYLEYVGGDLVLYAGYQTPQIYWSTTHDRRKSNTSVKSKPHSSSMVSDSWNFYDKSGDLLWQFIFSDNSDANVTWAVVLGSDGVISFYNLDKGKTVNSEAFKIPEDFCGVPEPCDPYYVCFFDNWCECPASLRSPFNCRPQKISTCDVSDSSVDLIYVGEKLDYFALSYAEPLSKPNLNACKEACMGNCSCLALFFDNSSNSCFLFDQIGSFERAKVGSNGYVSYMKISNNGGSSLGSADESNGRELKHMILVVVIVVLTVMVIAGLSFLGFWYRRKKMNFGEYIEEALEDDDILEDISGGPSRFNFDDLCQATKNFSTKIGQGGFGSVYRGVLPDGTQLAVKKLEGIGQGKKEFRSEVTTIGSIHHVHLVRLKGFCAEGPHRLLVYEYMGKGSLDKWIFRHNEEGSLLDWNTRFRIALGTAKGLAYLHEECEVKIVHCDVKPENVLLDDNFTAKVSDFGLAKLMNREQSLVYTTLRGTRGYLAPEWITNYAISEKSDVYSYGMVLLEIIGGRKNYDQRQCSEKAHFPSYASRLLEEGKVREIIDARIDVNDESEQSVVTAIKVALCCVQDDMNLRPPMTKVVQMLEGICAVPDPPSSSQLGSYSTFFKWCSGVPTSSSGIADSDAPSSAIRLSGPR